MTRLAPKGKIHAALLSLAIFLALDGLCRGEEAPLVKIGSKKFTESVILGEMVTHLVRDAGGIADHRRELGGTEILWQALRRGELDVYVEYTGTLVQVVLRDDLLHGDKSH